MLSGIATETTFERNAEGFLYPTVTRRLEAGAVCGTFDADIHQMSNIEAGPTDLVTLHVYAPPLLDMGTYSLTDATVGAFSDPVFEFAHGSGI